MLVCNGLINYSSIACKWTVFLPSRVLQAICSTSLLV
jgi:hypothetical protein